MKLHYAGYQPEASGFGWATCNRNLHGELSRLCEMVDHGEHVRYRDTVFMPLVNHDLEPASPAFGKVNLAYTFFEFQLGPNAAENAKQYDTVFCGSSWCLERMQERGITNGKVLIQGVDHSIFESQPSRQRDGQFRIFSGGKFEYRKGQDLVIAAFREFSKTHDDAHLVCSWFNPWPNLIPESLLQMGLNGCAKETIEFYQPTQANAFFTFLRNCGLGSDFDVYSLLPQQQLAVVMANTDIGLFPNRCEGGTNLVLMEYASCGRKVIANAKTGHADISEAISYEIPASNDENHWAVQEVDDIVAMLELAYENRDAVEHWSKSAHRAGWTWKAAAETIVEEARKFL